MFGLQKMPPENNQDLSILDLPLQPISYTWFSRWVMSDSATPHRLQHARLPCPSLSPWVCSNACPLSWWSAIEPCVNNFMGTYWSLIIISLYANFRRQSRGKKELTEKAEYNLVLSHCISNHSLYSITDSMNINLIGLREILKDRESWHAAVHGITKNQRQFSNWTTTTKKSSLQLRVGFHCPLFVFWLLLSNSTLYLGYSQHGVIM